jgi:hypothetical protein
MLPVIVLNVGEVCYLFLKLYKVKLKLCDWNYTLFYPKISIKNKHIFMICKVHGCIFLARSGKLKLVTGLHICTLIIYLSYAHWGLNAKQQCSILDFSFRPWNDYWVKSL